MSLGHLHPESWGRVFVLHALRRVSCARPLWLGLGRGPRAIRFCRSPSGKGTSGPAQLCTPRPALRLPPLALRILVPLPEQESFRALMWVRHDGPHLPCARDVSFSPACASWPPTPQSLSASLTSGFENTPRPRTPRQSRHPTPAPGKDPSPLGRQGVSRNSPVPPRGKAEPLNPTWPLHPSTRPVPSPSPGFSHLSLLAIPPLRQAHVLLQVFPQGPEGSSRCSVSSFKSPVQPGPPQRGLP